MEVRILPTALSGKAYIPKIHGCHLSWHESSVRVSKYVSRIGVSWSQSLSFRFFFQAVKGMPLFVSQVMTILALIGTICVIGIPWEDMVCGFGLKLMYITLIIYARSSLIHVHGFQLLVLSLLLKITSLVRTNRTGFLYLNWNSDRLIIAKKGILKLPNLLMLIKQKTLSLLRNLALVTFGELLIELSDNINLLFNRIVVLSSASDRQNCFQKTFLKTQILMTQVYLYLLFLLGLIQKCILSMWLQATLTYQRCLALIVFMWWFWVRAWTFIHTSWTFNMCLKEPCFPDC